MGTQLKTPQTYSSLSLSVSRLSEKSKMAAAFAGKWDLMEASNVEEILKATGIKSEFLELAASMVANQDEVLEEVAVDGDKLAITYYKNRAKVDTEELVIGQPMETETMDGRKVQVSVSVEGNKISSR